MLKKLLSITLVAIMIFSCMSVVAYADTGVVTDLEPNDDELSAQVIEPNATVQGTLATPDLEADEPYMDMDVFKFTLAERSKVTLTLTSSSKTVIPVIMDMEGEEGLTPELDEELEDLPEEMFVEGYLPAGEYYVALFDLFSETETTYKFTMTTKNAVQTLKKENGVWKYYVGGEFAAETTLFKYSGKWFYVKDGIWSSKVTTLAKYEDEWFYIKNGKWAKETTLVKYSDKWFYIHNGKWDREAKTLVKYKGSWFYVKNGKWAKETDIVKYSGKKFYVKGGKAQLSFSGKKKIKGQTYYIKNGKVV
jgi:hypothetical protein